MADDPHDFSGFFFNEFFNKDGWMDDLRFYVLFNSISVISGDVWMIMKGCVQWNSVYG